MNNSVAPSKIVHKGGCHCGAVRFEVRAPSIINAIECNCSICAKSGYLHLIVDPDDFTLISGDESLISYSFNTQTAKHLFCKACGIKSFYIPRSHPAGYSVNIRCLDPGSYSDIRVDAFDGVNWESAMGSQRL